MNWSDLAVVCIIIGFGIAGLASGLINSVFKIASYFVSIILAIKFYPVVSDLLMKTVLYTNIKASVKNNLAGGMDIPTAGMHNGTGTVIDSLALPKFLKGTLLDGIPDPSRLVDISSITDAISGQLSEIIINIISLILLYIVIRIAFIFLKAILKGIAKLPVFRQVDRLAGFILGLVEGLLTVYILLSVLTLFNASPKFAKVFAAIESSMIAKFFYENNFIINWMF
jgi:uncharacterized membrane protein required for colicin V production